MYPTQHTTGKTFDEWKDHIKEKMYPKREKKAGPNNIQPHRNLVPDVAEYRREILRRAEIEYDPEAPMNEENIQQALPEELPDPAHPRMPQIPPIGNPDRLNEANEVENIAHALQQHLERNREFPFLPPNPLENYAEPGVQLGNLFGANPNPLLRPQFPQARPQGNLPIVHRFNNAGMPIRGVNQPVYPNDPRFNLPPDHPIFRPMPGQRLPARQADGQEDMNDELDEGEEREPDNHDFEDPALQERRRLDEVRRQRMMQELNRVRRVQNEAPDDV